MKKLPIHSSLIHWNTLSILQLINAVVVIPLSFFLASQEGVKVLLGETLTLSGDLSPESSAIQIFMTLVVATIALLAGLASVFISLMMLREKEWTLLGTTIAQGCIIGTEFSKFFLYIKPNFIALLGALIIVILCLLKLKQRADRNKKASIPLDPTTDPVKNEQ